jgi:hypothetical protein
VAPGGSDAPEGAWREPASVSEAPGERPGNAERLAVLEAVERGELDIEEALRLLEPADVIASP